MIPARVILVLALCACAACGEGGIGPLPEPTLVECQATALTAPATGGATEVELAEVVHTPPGGPPWQGRLSVRVVEAGLFGSIPVEGADVQFAARTPLTQLSQGSATTNQNGLAAVDVTASFDSAIVDVTASTSQGISNNSPLAVCRKLQFP
jgi:hypothetical protein